MTIQQLVTSFWQRNAAILDSSPASTSRNSPASSVRSSPHSSMASRNSPSRRRLATLFESVSGSFSEGMQNGQAASEDDPVTEASFQTVDNDTQEDGPKEESTERNDSFVNDEDIPGDQDNSKSAPVFVTPPGSPERTSASLTLRTPQKTDDRTSSGQLLGGSGLKKEYRKPEYRETTKIKEFVLSILAVLSDKTVDHQSYINNLLCVIQNPNKDSIDLPLHLHHLELTMQQTDLSDEDKKLILAYVLYQYLKDHKERIALFPQSSQNKADIKQITSQLFYMNFTSTAELSASKISVLYDVYINHIKPKAIQKENEELFLQLESLIGEDLFTAHNTELKELKGAITALTNINKKNELLKFFIDILQKLKSQSFDSGGEVETNWQDIRDKIVQAKNEELLLQIKTLLADTDFHDYQESFDPLKRSFVLLNNKGKENEILEFLLYVLNDLKIQNLSSNSKTPYDWNPLKEYIKEKLTALEKDLGKENACFTTLINFFKTISENEPDVVPEDFIKTFARTHPIGAGTKDVSEAVDEKESETIDDFLKTDILNDNQKTILTTLQALLKKEDSNVQLKTEKSVVSLLNKYSAAKKLVQEPGSTYDWKNFLPDVKEYEKSLTYKTTPSQKVLRGCALLAGVLLGTLIGFALGVTIGACIGGGVGSVVPLWGNIVVGIGGAGAGGIIGAVKGAGIGASIGAAVGMALTGIAGGALADVGARKYNEPDYIYTAKSLGAALKPSPVDTKKPS